MSQKIWIRKKRAKIRNVGVYRANSECLQKVKLAKEDKLWNMKSKGQERKCNLRLPTYKAGTGKTEITVGTDEVIQINSECANK